MSSGWVKIYRSILDDPVWTSATPDQKAVLIAILLLASHKESQWFWGDRKYQVQPGQLITSLNSLATKADVSVKSVRSAIARFEKLDFLTNESAKTGRLISVKNWGRYQSCEDAPGKVAGKDPAKTRQLSRSKELKTEVYSANFLKFWTVFEDKRGKKKAWSAWSELDPDDSLAQEIIEGAKRYSALRPSLVKKGQTPKMAQGWLSDRRWEDDFKLPAEQSHLQLVGGYSPNL
jgi:hypothetical protein